MYEPTQTVGIETISADIEENDVRLRLNIIDTPGSVSYTHLTLPTICSV